MIKTKISKKYNTAKTLPANIRKKNRGTNCRYQYQGTNSVGQA